MKKTIVSAVVLAAVCGVVWFAVQTPESVEQTLPDTDTQAEDTANQVSYAAPKVSEPRESDGGRVDEAVEIVNDFEPVSLQQALIDGMPESGADEEIIDMSEAEYAAPVDMSEEENAEVIDMSEASLAPEVRMQQ